MSSQAALRGLVLLPVVFWLSSGTASGQVLITHGDTISHVGDVPAKNREPGLPSTKVGFKYSYWGIFWLDFWTWDGEYCLYQDKKFWKLTPAEAAALLGVPESSLSKPFLWYCPLGLLIFGPLILLGIYAQIVGEKKTDPLAKLFQDTRYQKALNIMTERLKQQEPAAPDTPAAGDGQTATPEAPPAGDGQTRFQAAFDAGLQHLLDSGIPREEAERNLGMMVQALANAPRQQS
jgi:hypothetical protein